jgi:hypothetical protein
LPAGPSARRPYSWAAAAVLLILYYVMAVSAVAQKSMTFDEMAHLTGGYTYWAFNDYRLHPENGNWPQRLGALPAILSGASFPSLDQPAWTNANVYVIGDQFLYSSGNDADTMLGRGRLLVALVAVVLGALVYAWASRLVSPAAGLLSLVLFVFSPTLLAHGPLVTSDTMASLFFTAAVGAMWVMLQRITPLTVFGSAVLVAGAFLSKLSGPILVPIAAVMVAVRLISTQALPVRVGRRSIDVTGRLRQLGILAGAGVVIGLVAWVILWASFGFRYSAFHVTTGADTFLGHVTEQPGLGGWMLATARQFHLLPEAYIYGLGLTVQFASERASFLNGQFGTTGWWWYFPYAFLVKTTIPGMIVGVLAIAAFVARRRNQPDRRAIWIHLYAATPLVALIVIYMAFALTTHLNIGHRHLLPIYPALCILAGGAAYWLESFLQRPSVPVAQSGRDRRKQRSQARATTSRSPAVVAAGVATAVLLAWHVGESLTIRPDYLAYFNQLAGGPSEGYKHLADSSLDWGQDLPALKKWLDREGLQPPGATNVYLSYFGTARPEYYGIQATMLPGFIDRRPPQPPVPLKGGVYCVSATVLDVIGTMFYKPEYESNYQAGLQNLNVFTHASESDKAALVQQMGAEYWSQLFVQVDQMRMGRLTAWLRQRRPDATVGYSILIYRLSDADVQQAVGGP